MRNKIINFSILAWSLIIILQAYFTELHPDEAYYWSYSQNLEWGHFHQPPMIAVFVKIGYSIFQNELGVRLMTILTHLLSLYLILKMANPKRIGIYLLVLGSLLMIHGGSLLAVPDSPLVFFCTLFLYLFKSYLEKDHWLLILGLGVTAGAILLSKYHGAIFLLLLLLSNWRIFRRPSLYLILLIAACLFWPHINWQLQHDWPSLRFHTGGRDHSDFRWSRLLEYVGFQLLMLGPVLLLSIRRIRLTDPFQRSLAITAGGIFLFFFLLSFRNTIEANWTATAFVPLLILAGPAIDRFKNTQWIKIYGIAILGALMLFRIELATAVFGPFPMNFKYGRYQLWTEELKEKIEGKPLLLYNSYQLTSLYQFYTGAPVVCRILSFRPANQFYYYQWNENFMGKELVLAQNHLGACHSGMDSIQNDAFKNPWCLQHLKGHPFYNDIHIDLNLPDAWHANDSIALELSFEKRLPGFDRSAIQSTGPSQIMLTIKPDYGYHSNYALNIDFTDSLIGKTLSRSIQSPTEAGVYRVSAGIASHGLEPQLNSHFFTVEVVKD